jgi:hypothetical protein
MIERQVMKVQGFELQLQGLRLSVHSVQC